MTLDQQSLPGTGHGMGELETPGDDGAGLVVDVGVTDGVRVAGEDVCEFTGLGVVHQEISVDR